MPRPDSPRRPSLYRGPEATSEHLETARQEIAELSAEILAAIAIRLEEYPDDLRELLVMRNALQQCIASINRGAGDFDILQVPEDGSVPRIISGVRAG